MSERVPLYAEGWDQDGNMVVVTSSFYRDTAIRFTLTKTRASGMTERLRVDLTPFTVYEYPPWPDGAVVSRRVLALTDEDRARARAELEREVRGQCPWCLGDKKHSLALCLIAPKGSHLTVQELHSGV